MGNYYEQGRLLIMPPPSDWEVSQDRPEEVEGIEQCLPGENGHPSDDYQGLKRLVVDRFNSRAHFIEPNQTPTGQQANPDNRSWRATLYSTNGLSLPRQPDNLNPSPVQPLGTCRVDGEVYVYKSHPILTKFCDASSLPFVQSTLETVSVEEAFLIGRLLEGANDRNLYCFSQPSYRPRSKRGLFVNKENVGSADRLVEGLRQLSDKGKMAPARVEALRSGINNAVRNQRMAQEGLEMGRDQAKEIKNQKWFWAGLTLLPFALANDRVRNAVVKSVSLAVRAIWERNARAELRSSLRRLVRGLSWTQLQRVGQNLTEKARRGELSPVVDKTTPEVAGRVEKRIGKKERAASAVVTAPAGWGKEKLMETLALRNRHLEIFSTSPDSIMAGTKYRGDLEERIVDIPAEIEKSLHRGTRVILFMDEVHEAFFAGRSEEEIRALLERWKGPLARGDLVIVGFTTPKEWLSVRWAAGMLPEILTPQQQEWVREFEGNPKLRRNAGLRPLVKRFMTIDAPARPAEDIEAMLQDEVETRRKGGARIVFSQDAIRRMARASLSEVPGEGHIPRTAFDVFDSIVAEYEERANGAEVNVGVGDVDRILKSDWPEIASRMGITTGAASPESGRALAPAAQVALGNGGGAPTNGEVPVDLDHVVMELEDRYPVFENSHNRLATIALARDIMTDWERQGRPNSSSIPGLPPEEFLELHFRRFVQVAEARRDLLGREAVRSDRGRREERGREDLARRVLEHVRRAAEHARGA